MTTPPDAGESQAQLRRPEARVRRAERRAPADEAIPDARAGDAPVAGLLLLHGLHPDAALGARRAGRGGPPGARPPGGRPAGGSGRPSRRPSSPGPLIDPRMP
jgi:hypothetical protein